MVEEGREGDRAESIPGILAAKDHKEHKEQETCFLCILCDLSRLIGRGMGAFYRRRLTS
jgi:hypothetical protein